ncbi:MAG TPA: hypothetical protein VJ020_14460 [Anaerolineales bacterium]|nr:hypothetical protein [Anaerolineales bacterium]
MPLDPIAAHAAADKIALFAAVRAAENGTLPWTAELISEHNRLWFAEHRPDILAELPHITEEGICECGCLCFIWAVIGDKVIHRCACGPHWYSISLDFYRKVV